jgi:hypothetical protein
MALPLIALAATVLPEILRSVAGDRAGDVAAHVAAAVRSIAGTDDAAEAERRLAADPAAAATLRIRLAEIALEQEQARQQAGLEEMRARLADTQGARGTMVSLAQAGSLAAWGAPLVSSIVTLGFFGTLILLVAADFRLTDANQFLAALLNITIGALVAAFSAVVNFWIGSSDGSRAKDATVQNLHLAQAQQAERAILGLQEVARTASPGAAAPATRPDRFDACLSLVLEQEGGFVNHADDPGGATNFGITLATLADFRDREATAEDVRSLTREEAREIYRANYWVPMRCAELPPGIDLAVFDLGVNAGPRRALRLLQKVAGVTQDGSIGPITLAAVKARRPEAIVNELARERLEYYRGLGTFASFGRGWTNRTEAVREAALRMAMAAATPA